MCVRVCVTEVALRDVPDECEMCVGVYVCVCVCEYVCLEKRSWESCVRVCVCVTKMCCADR